MASPVVPNGDGGHIVAADYRSKALDSHGRQAFKGGQNLNDPIIDSVTAAYANLVYSPVSLILFSFGAFILLAEAYQSHGPLEMLSSKLADLHSSPNTSPFLRDFLILPIVLFNGILPHKIFFGKICIIWFTYVNKPSSRHLFLGLALSIIFFLSDTSFIQVFLISQIFFLFSALRNPRHKFLLIIIGIYIFFSNLFHQDLITGLKNYNDDLIKPLQKVQSTTTTTARP